MLLQLGMGKYIIFILGAIIFIGSVTMIILSLTGSGNFLGTKQVAYLFSLSIGAYLLAVSINKIIKRSIIAYSSTPVFFVLTY